MDSKQFEAMLSDAETRLRRLKTLYDQWFSGIERMEPAVARKEHEDLLVKLRRETVNNTALRFRLQQIVQRHTTFTTYWRRIARQIEDGTFKRDLVRARKRGKRGAELDDVEPELSYEIDVELDIDGDYAEADTQVDARMEQPEEPARTLPQAKPADAKPDVRPADAKPGPAAPPRAAVSLAPPQPPPRLVAPPPPLAAGASAFGSKPRPPVPPLAAGAPLPSAPKPAGPGQSVLTTKTVTAIKPAVPTVSRAPGAPAASHKPQPVVARSGDNGAALSSEDVQRIYSKYVAARQQNSERTDNVKLDSIEKTLRGMLPSLEKKHAGKKIDFEVVVKDGKVALKPVAK